VECHRAWGAAALGQQGGIKGGLFDRERGARCPVSRAPLSVGCDAIHRLRGE